MTKWALRMSFLAACCGAIWLLVVHSRPADPVWQGKKLSQWLTECKSYAPNDLTDDAQKAIRAMGTNALPYLVWMIGQTDSNLKEQFRSRLSPNLMDRLTPLREIDRGRAAVGFEALGKDAAPAIPDLMKLLDNDRPNCVEAGYALSRIGPPALPLLVQALTNQNVRVKVGAMQALGYMPPAAEALPGLLQCLSDSDPTARGLACFILGDMQNQSDVLLPKLYRSA